ncbi:hypothetical protein [Plantibacter sp. CFBP 8775]|uniref:hypothetical protein n=1 Tax=Plantibacter sp. CFBP 8775 TaxID=2774038 RepID=UPI00177B5E85|nr:hypothetical protein [Plantibacter sp. CFBP 8775]MBD8104764.1 hypothetical protein [Plantibacter sp. CFBP 8775]
MHLFLDIIQAGLLPALEPKEIPGIGTIVNTILGYILWAISIASIVGLFVIGGKGYEAYKHNQAEEMVESSKWWLLGSVLGSFAPQLVLLFFPGLRPIKIAAVEIPGVGGVITDLLGYVLWILCIAAIVALLAIAALGFNAFKHNQGEQFIEKTKYWAIGSVLVSFAVPIATQFFPNLAIL